MTEVLMKVLPLMVSLLSCTVNSATPDVGEDQIGCKTTEHCFPFLALLVNLNGICTAAIVSPSWMLSSAYCYTKSSGRTCLAYAGSGDLAAAEQLQVRCAQAVMWGDPATGAVARDPAERSAVALLLTTAPWTYTEAVHSVAIGEIHLSPLAPQESYCITVGFHLDKNLAVTPCGPSLHWNEDGHACFNSVSDGGATVAPGSLIYCYRPEILIGVALASSDLPPNTRDGSIPILESCFTYLGGALLTSLRQITENDSVTDDLRVRLLYETTTHHVQLKETKHVDRSFPASRNATKLHTKSDLNNARINEHQEDFGKSSWLVKRYFDLDVSKNKTAGLLEYTENSTAALQPPLADAMWALVLVPLVAIGMLVIYRTAVWKKILRLYTSIWRKRGSYNYENM